MTIEAATTGRAKCRGCKKTIERGTWRFGDEVYGSIYGTMTFWYHLPCAVAQRPEQLGRKLARMKRAFPGRADIEAAIPGAVPKARLARLAAVDLAPNGRWKCKQCKTAIEKDALRVMVLLGDAPATRLTGFVHAACAPAFVAQPPVAVQDYLAGRAGKKLAGGVTALFTAIDKLVGDARGRELEELVRKAKKPEAEISVLADWLEEQGCRLPDHELRQLLKVRAKKPRARRVRA